MANKSKKNRYGQKLIEKTLEKLDADYLEARKKESEELHNAICDVLAEKQASPQNTVFVLLMLLYETLTDQYQQLFGTPLSSKSPQPITGEPKSEEG